MTVTEPTGYWVDTLNAAGIPCGPIYQMDEVFGDEQVKHLEVAQTVNSPGRGETSILAQPVILERTPSHQTGAGPPMAVGLRRSSIGARAGPREVR